MSRKVVRIKIDDFWKGGMPFKDTIIYELLKDEYDFDIRVDDDVDYLLYSIYSDRHLNSRNDVIKICYSGEDFTPDFNLCDYALAFDWLDYGDRYFRLPYNYFHRGVIKTTRQMEIKHEISDDILSYTKRNFCSFTVSNAWGESIREQFFHILNGYKNIDSGGKWMNNVGGPVKDKLEFDKKHKFSICFENQSHSGYTTEKIIDGFAARTIPIYWGDPDIGRVFNKKAFICVNDYASLESVVDEVKRLDNNDEAYIEMLRQPALLNEEWTFDSVCERLKPFLCHILTNPSMKPKGTLG